MGAAVGATAGGLLLVIALCVGFVYLRRRAASQRPGDIRVIVITRPPGSMPEITSPQMAQTPLSHTVLSQTISELTETSG